MKTQEGSAGAADARKGDQEMARILWVLMLGFAGAGVGLVWGQPSTTPPDSSAPPKPAPVTMKLIQTGGPKTLRISDPGAQLPPISQSAPTVMRLAGAPTESNAAPVPQVMNVMPAYAPEP